MGRQYTPLPLTPMKNFPSKRTSRESRAREQIRQSSSIILPMIAASGTRIGRFRTRLKTSLSGDCFGFSRQQCPESSRLVERSPQTSSFNPRGNLSCTMGNRLRHCVECPRCRMRYLVASSPYGNGSRLVQIVPGSTDEYVLYCACGTPAVASRWKSNEMNVCEVSKAAHSRGYGMSDEIYVIHSGRKTTVPPSNPTFR